MLLAATRRTVFDQMDRVRTAVRASHPRGAAASPSSRVRAGAGRPHASVSTEALRARWCRRSRRSWRRAQGGRLLAVHAVPCARQTQARRGGIPYEYLDGSTHRELRRQLSVAEWAAGFLVSLKAGGRWVESHGGGLRLPARSVVESAVEAQRSIGRISGGGRAGDCDSFGCARNHRRRCWVAGVKRALADAIAEPIGGVGVDRSRGVGDVVVVGVTRLRRTDSTALSSLYRGGKAEHHGAARRGRPLDKTARR